MPGYISSLVSIESGSYDEENSSMELKAPKGEAKVFVIAGGGSGRNLYRRLQRQQTAFVTGILYENDLDAPAARALASEAFLADAFEPVPEALQKKAAQRLSGCEKVICCRKNFGSYESANRALLDRAVQLGKEVEFL